MKINSTLITTTICLIISASNFTMDTTNKSLKSKKKLSGVNFNTINVKLNEYGTTTLHSAVYYGGNATLVQSLLNAKDLDIDVQDIYGNTPLHSAISLSANTNIILQLLNSGADINIKNKNNHASLDLAKKTLRKDIIEYLINWPKTVVEKIKKDADPYLPSVLGNIIGEYVIGQQKLDIDLSE